MNRVMPASWQLPSPDQRVGRELKAESYIRQTKRAETLKRKGVA